MKSIFFSYSHKDEALRDQLEVHLAMLKRQGVISTWHDRRLVAGDDVDTGIAEVLNEADMILLLVSPDFLASDYCYGVEVARALERHAAGQARVIPIVLRPCEWHAAPFGRLLAAPSDGRPVTKWPDTDDAFLDITRAIRAAAGAMPAKPNATRGTAEAMSSVIGPRSSNLRVRKRFTERDRDQFLSDAFEFMALFFENSLKELEERNPSIETTFRRIDANRFTVSIYREGENIARCKIWLGGIGGAGIAFSYNANPDDNSLNETISVEASEQYLFFATLGHANASGFGERAPWTRRCRGVLLESPY